MIQWRIYYADGSTLDGEDEPNIPISKCFQVQIIVQPDLHHRWEFLSFGDYYLWRTDLKRWVGVDGDLSAMMALTVNIKEITGLVWGSMMDPYAWEKIQQRVRDDFPEKSGQRKHDRVRR